MIATTLLILDCLAIALLLPVIAWVIDSHVSISRGTQRLIPRAVFRTLEGWTNHRTAGIAYIALDYLLARLVWRMWASDQPLVLKIGVSLAALALAMGLVQPFLKPFSMFISLFVRTPAIHIDRARHFPGAAILEDPKNWRRIRAELDAFLERTLPVPSLDAFVPDMAATNTDVAMAAGLKDNSWRTFWTRAVGIDLESRHELPFLTSLLEPMRPRLNTIFLSLLDPGVVIDKHRGPYRGLLRYHLGLVVPEPEKQWLECDGVRHQWREGEGMLFDPVCVHHVWSDTTATRIILIVDVPRRLPWLLDLLNRAVMYPGRWHPFFRRFRTIEQVHLRPVATQDQPSTSASARDATV